MTRILIACIAYIVLTFALAMIWNMVLFRDTYNLVTSIKSLGIIQPLLVRKNCQGYEVVAGQRRLKAAQTIAEQNNEKVEPIPCAILEEEDDATAIEASLAENIARLPMDEIDQFEAFATLKKQGKTIDDIANDFGVTERLVKQRLAIAGLHPPILNAYRKDEISVEIMRILTMATKRQQKQWLALFRDPEQHAPRGYQLKAWLFAGAEIPVSSAIFSVDAYKGAIKGDLFGKEQYFTNSAKFWECQNKAIAAKVETYQQEGWQEVIVMEIGEHFYPYDKIERSKIEGGKIYVSCAANGEVSFHEGFIEEKQAKKLELLKAKADGTYQTPERCELTKAAQDYFERHRHGAVRAELLKQPAIALRLIVAHALCGSSLWSVKPENPTAGRNEAVNESLATSKAFKIFTKERKAVIELLDLEGERDYLIASDWTQTGLSLPEIFAKLLELDDKKVMRILTFTMSETLAIGTGIIEALGNMLKTDMSEHWQPDDAFYDLLRDKQMINTMLSEIGGKTVAAGNITSTAKVQKQIIRDHVEGNGSRQQAKNWLPRFMHFPILSYTQRSGLNAMAHWQGVKRLFNAK